ncbi:MAG: tetratricopeptide repeat protein [Candidatus Kapaibacterium sp.]
MEELRLDRLERLFRAALMHPPEEREHFLEAACTDDIELRAEVLSLLQSDQQAEEQSFLNKSITDVINLEKVIEEKGANPEKMVDREIGPYRVLRFLGHGGMGDVFLAVRDEPFRHHVALKIIRRGMDTDEVIRRFEMERQILASLNHPNMARLYDGGVTDDGVPYFAMEYVDGTPIVQWCDSRGMGLDDRLRLFQDVCNAVHHAHQNLIIHRDLKPSNILVTKEGIPKLLDFGIAKLLNPNLGPLDAPITRTEIRAMTPEYASPEQVRGESLTTVSDVYSLGMILYELLAGQAPYRLVRRTSEEILSVVCEQEPELPSTVVVRNEEGKQPAATVAGKRGISPDQLSKRLRGDLDNIVSMALRKEPERRYSSAQQLANDIERYLTGEPVIAHKNSRSYRIKKFIQRNRIQTISGMIILLLLVAATGLTIYQSNQIAKQRDRAQLEAERGASVTEFLVSLFRAADPTYSPGDTLTVRELLASGAERVETELANQPEIQATLYDVIGTAYLNLGRFKLAESLFERGLALQRKLHSEGKEFGAALYNLGFAKEMLSNYSDAEKLYREFLTVSQELSGKVSTPYVIGLFHLGSVVHISGRTEEANQLFDEWEKLHDQLEDRSDPELAEVTFGMTKVCFARKEYAKAERYIREVLDAARKTYGEKHPNVSSALSMLSSIQVAVGENVEAEETIRESLKMLQELYPEGHQEIALAYGILAEILEQQKKLSEAEEYFIKSIQLQEKMVGENHQNTSLAKAELGRFYGHQKRYAESEEWYRDAHDSYAGAYGQDNLMTILLRKSLAEAMIMQGKKEKAAEILKRDYATLLRDRGADYTTTKEVKEMLENLQKQ